MNPNPQIQDILQLSIETLEKASDAQLEKLLGSLVPKSRVSNKDAGATDLKRSIALLEKIIKKETK